MLNENNVPWRKTTSFFLFIRCDAIQNCFTQNPYQIGADFIRIVSMRSSKMHSTWQTEERRYPRDCIPSIIIFSVDFEFMVVQHLAMWSAVAFGEPGDENK